MFNLENSIQSWKSELRSNPVFEDGDIAELESHLREEIERLKVEGMSEENAFQKAVEDVGESESIGDELYKSRATQKAGPVPPWKQRSWVPSLLPNYFKIAFRNLIRNKGYTFINIGGLAVGLACCMLAIIYVRYEFSFDRSHEKADRIYRIVETRTSQQGEQRFAKTTAPLAPAMLEELPAVVETVRFDPFYRLTIGHRDVRFYEDNLLFTEPSFFDVFDFKLLQGNPETVLTEPLTVVLTESSARKYFGSENPMGKTLTVEEFGEMTVTGVMEDPPDNSHLDFSMLFPFAEFAANSSWWEDWSTDWDPPRRVYITYVVLEEGAKAAAVETKLAALLDRHHSEGTPPQRIDLQPLTAIHFGSAGILADRNQNEGNFTYVWIFALIALFIVLIAAINYMNLATARSAQRAREVGLRKAAGAHRRQLIGQFLGESILLTLLAFLMALVIVQVMLPVFSALANRELTFNLFESGWPIIGLLGLVLGIGILAGCFPAFYLSRFQPARVLKGLRETQRSATALRRSLVIVQFTLSIIMIAGTLVFYQQLQYVQEKKLGFEEEQMVVIDINDDDVRDPFKTVKEEFERYASVKSVTASSSVPGDWKPIPRVEVVPEGAQESMMVHFFAVDADFLETYKIGLAEGRGFLDNRATDSTAVLINGAAARAFGWENPVGKVMRLPEEEFQGRVIGVVQDFHFQSLHEEIGPVVIGHVPNPVSSIDYFTVRISGANVPATIDHLRAVGKRFDTEHPFEYHFLDEQIAQFYETEVRTGRLTGLFAVLAILIACLGLFGLASYMAEQRTKEIAIRKILGASVTGILALFSKNFLKLVGIAFIIAAPVAYFAMQQWLQDFAYRIEIGPGIFLLAGGLALIIALATVSWQSIRAALANPVKSLRSE